MLHCTSVQNWFENMTVQNSWSAITCLWWNQLMSYSYAQESADSSQLETSLQFSTDCLSTYIRVSGFFSGYATTLCLLLGPLLHNTAPAGWKHDSSTFEDMILLSLDSYFSSYQYPPTIHGIMPTVRRSQHGSSALQTQHQKKVWTTFSFKQKTMMFFFCIILIAFNLFIF